MGLPTQSVLLVPKINARPRLFTLSKFYCFDVDGVDILQSAFEDAFYQLPVVSIFEVKQWHRIDTISYLYYNSTDYWWMILLFNNWLDPRHLPPTLNLFDAQRLKMLVSLPGRYKVIETPYQLGQSLI